MVTSPGPGEPLAGPWQVIEIAELLDVIFASAPEPVGRSCVLAIDGRSGSGKSTLADRIHRAMAPSTIVHTDDIAWHHDFFDWSHLLVEGVLRPVWNGQAVCYQPPAGNVWGDPEPSRFLPISAWLSSRVLVPAGSTYSPGLTAQSGFSRTSTKPNAAASFEMMGPTNPGHSGGNG